MKAKKTKKVKAYAIIKNDGELLDSYNTAHSVFMPRIYKTAESARNVLRRINDIGDFAFITQCEITYKI